MKEEKTYIYAKIHMFSLYILDRSRNELYRSKSETIMDRNYQFYRFKIMDEYQCYMFG